MKKVIIAGGRNFYDYKYLESCIKNKFSQNEINNWEIVSGHAEGADSQGENFAELNNLKLTKFPADWNKYGNLAGRLRNEEMAKYVKGNGMLIAFWDGVSRGTKHIIHMAKKYEIESYVFYY
jgi:hypothetical protein